MLCWYAVHTRPRAEAKALTHLRRQGFEAYLPQMTRRSVQADGRAASAPAAMPLFPRRVNVAIGKPPDLKERALKAIVPNVSQDRRERN
ncbi:MAG: transcription termination/antitermination NusG family protein [Rhodospirillales bacterium]